MEKKTQEITPAERLAKECRHFMALGNLIALTAVIFGVAWFFNRDTWLLLLIALLFVIVSISPYSIAEKAKRERRELRIATSKAVPENEET